MCVNHKPGLELESGPFLSRSCWLKGCLTVQGAVGPEGEDHADPPSSSWVRLRSAPSNLSQRTGSRLTKSLFSPSMNTEKQKSQQQLKHEACEPGICSLANGKRENVL